jgi:hypothetical protein
MTLLWTVNGGTIVTGQGTSQVVVRWDSTASEGRVRVARSFAGGCIDSALLDLDVQPFVSVQEEQFTDLVVRPNPAADRITIDAPWSIVRVSLTATSGITMLDMPLGDAVQSTTIGVENLPAGAYTIHVTTAAGTVHRPLIIQR